jgi:hypothetical protein
VRRARRHRGAAGANNRLANNSFAGGSDDGGGDGGGTSVDVNVQGDGDEDDSSGPFDWLKRIFGGSSSPPAAPPEAPPAAPAPSGRIPDDDPSLEALDIPAAARVPRDGPRQSLTQRTYTVQQGDWPAKIAKRFGAAARPHWLMEFEHANPHKRVDSGTGSWFNLNPGEIVNIPDAWPAMSADTGSIEEDEEAGAPRQNLTRRTYAVVAGDGMQRIAQKLGAAERPHWFGELRDANPHKEMLTKGGKQIGWKSLYPGEIINVPDAWPDSTEVRPVPGGVPTPAPYMGLPTFPKLPGATPSPMAPPGTVPAAASVDPGTILRAQGILTAWGRLYPNEIQPRDFGAGSIISPDLLSVPTPRTQQAIASFQRWSNAKAGTRLRTDGVLDPDTIAALDSFSAQALGGLVERPPVPPIPGGTPSVWAERPSLRPVGPDRPAELPPAASAPRGASADPWSGLYAAAASAAGELARRAQANPPAPPPLPVQEVLRDLPDVLQQYGVPGVPGLPGGAPHAQAPREGPPRDAPPRDAPLRDAPRPEEPLPLPPRPPRPRIPEPRPVRIPAPRPAPLPAPPPDPPVEDKDKKSDVVIPALLAGLGVISGVLG